LTRLAIKKNFGIFFNQEGPTHLVNYENEKPVNWKHFTEADKQFIAQQFSNETQATSRQFFGHPKVKYVFKLGNRIGYGLYYPKHKGIVTLSNDQEVEVEWPNVVIEYPNMALYYHDPKKGYGLLNIPNQYGGGLCTGNTYFDLEIHDFELAWKHVKRQFFNAKWGHSTTSSIDMEQYKSDIKFKL